MKLLVVASSLDLRAPYSCTPSWWQLLKGLAEAGVEVVATPYQGVAVESLWWRCYPNPCQREGDLFAALRSAARRLPRARRGDGEMGGRGDGGSTRHSSLITHHSSLSPQDELVRRLAQAWVAPRWRRHLERILQRERGVDAVLMLTVPLNQIAGVAGGIREKHGIPFVFYDGDVPASLPRFRGFASGFRIYQGADLSEYDLFVSNSMGGCGDLAAMGARRVDVLYYGVDPDLFRPVEATQDIDVFFYGHGPEYRQEWIRGMLMGPSEAMPERRFAMRGIGFGDDLGRVEMLPYLSFSRLMEYCCRSKVNLNIVRGAHASVYGSSIARIFELAALGCCVVTNPYLGIEEWLEPGREVLVVGSEAEAVSVYRSLLADEGLRREMGSRARDRVLRDHTMNARARRLAGLIAGLKRDQGSLRGG